MKKILICAALFLAFNAPVRSDYTYTTSVDTCSINIPGGWWHYGVSATNASTFGLAPHTATAGYCGLTPVNPTGAGHLLVGGSSPGEVRLTVRIDPNDINNADPNEPGWEIALGPYPNVVGGWDVPYMNPAGQMYGVAIAPYGGIWVYYYDVDGNGAQTQMLLGSAGSALHDGSTIRAVGANGYIFVYVDNSLVLRTPSGFPGNLAGPVGFAVTGYTNVNTMVTHVDLGAYDTTPPTPIPASSIGVSAFWNHIDIQWPPTSDTGTGVYEYEVSRNGFDQITQGLSVSDAAGIAPNQSYNYTLTAYDYHGNASSTQFTVTTPRVPTNPPYPSASPEGRSVGVRTTGTYWGASGENIDVRSGNLSFALPLLKAQARGGWGVPFNLIYNSQNWRQDSGGTWQFDGDAGFGFGWRLITGSITPVYSDPYTVAYYLYMDASGAEYRLDQQGAGNIWSSKDSVYVYFDGTANILHFRDGSFWNFGCVSAGTEADSGVMYPTLIEDANGNQILIRYNAAAGAGWTNSSSRIAEIEDVRAAQLGTNHYATYTFTYNTDSVPHLTAIASQIGSGENYAFQYTTGVTRYSPFNNQAYGTGTTATLNRATISNIGTYYQFQYDAAIEMTRLTLPYKGYLAYDYTTTTYSSGRSYREVQRRYLSKDGSTQTTYTLSHEGSPGSDVHSYTVLDDPGGVGEKYWAFGTSGVGMGLVTQYQGRQLPGPVTLTQNDFTWTQDSVGNSYIGTSYTTADPGQSYAMQRRTDQTLDIYGNPTQTVSSNYAGMSPPSKTYTYTYLHNTGQSGANGSQWGSRYILNRPVQVTLSGGGASASLAANQYDTCIQGSAAPSREWDAGVQGVTFRGNLCRSITPGGVQYKSLDNTGNTIQSSANGVGSTATIDASTNYAAPTAMSVGGMSSSMSWNSFLGLTSETGPNGDTVSLGYDANARPTSTTSPFGAVTSTAYGDTGTPPTKTVSVNGRWTRTTMDGLGRPIKVETGDSSSTKSVAETVYDSCGCSPLGKMKQTASPHAPGATPNWTTYTYDGIGRTLSVVAADGASTTTYLYQGNTVKVTDPAGKWKQYWMDAFGQLIQVMEPGQ